MRQMDSYGNIYDDELFHEGKKGMKWGKHIMAQERYWITGNGRNLGGNGGGYLNANGQMNARMRSDTSGIKWKPTVAPSGGFKPAAGKGGAVTPGRTYNRAVLQKALPEYKNIKPSFKRNGRYVNRKVVPTSNPGIKGVNTAPQVSKSTSGNQIRANAIKNGYGNLAVGNPKFTAVNNLLFNSGTSSRVGSTMKKGISAMQQKPSVIKKAKKKAASGMLKVASKLLKWLW